MTAEDPADGLLQLIQEFTVQIRDHRTNEIVGAGFLVASDRIVTCAHVLEDAGVDPISGAARGGGRLGRLFGSPPHVQGLVRVVLASSAGGTRWTGSAELHGRLHDSDDDIVVLAVAESSATLRPTQLAVLGKAAMGARHPFLSYGFPALGEYEGHRVDGIIGEAVPAPALRLQAERIQVHPRSAVRPGMSGAPVLDEVLNLVVGVLVESTEVSTGATGPGDAWAVDARVLALDPFAFPVFIRPLPRRRMPQSAPAAPLESVALASPGAYRSHDPRFEDEAARTGLLRELATAARDPGRRMLVLLGFGGQGKSTLAQVWERTALSDQERSALFWWTFDSPDIDAFFEAAVNHFTRGRAELGQDASSAQRMQLLTSLLGVHRYVLVLDGVEATQVREGPRRGAIADPEFSHFLQTLAAGDHKSMALLTSRLSIADLVNAPSASYREWHIARLSEDEGRHLLTARGVRGPDADLDMLVAAWDGHPLSLVLLAGIILERCGGHAGRALHISLVPATGKPSDRLGPLLQFYDDILTPSERAVLVLVSAYRIPVSRLQMTRAIAGQASSPSSTLRELAGPQEAVDAALGRLASFSLLTCDAHEQTYTLHPLLREHYRAGLDATDELERRALHSVLYHRFLDEADAVPLPRSVGELSPCIEAVYHACRAGLFDDALMLYRDRLEGDNMRLSYQWNAYSTVLTLMDALLAGVGDGSLSGANARYIVNRRGVALMNSGRLAEAAEAFELAIAIGTAAGDVIGAAQSAENLSEVSIYRGRLTDSLAAARRATTLATQIEDPEARNDELRDCHCYTGWAASLAGQDTVAEEAFADAERLQRLAHPDQPVLLDIWGIAQADFLRRQGQAGRARTIVETNLQYALDEGLIDDQSICHRLLGELDADDGEENWASAKRHLDAAVQIARSISERTVLIEALTARGRVGVEIGNAAKGAADLNEASQYAASGEYALLQIDIRLGQIAHLVLIRDAETADDELVNLAATVRELGYGWAETQVQRLQERVRNLLGRSD